MIIDNINNIETYKHFTKLYRMLKEMLTCFNGDFPTNQIVISEASLFINPSTFTTKPEEECFYEAHKSFIDIHLIVEGHERIMGSPLNQLTAISDFDYTNDIGFYKGEHQTNCILSPKDFMVCFPQDAHKVSVLVSQPEHVKKLVGKIKI